MNKEEIEKMELEYTNAIRERIENAEKCGIGLDAVLTIWYRMIKLQDRIDKAIQQLDNIKFCVKHNKTLCKCLIEIQDILRGKDDEK